MIDDAPNQFTSFGALLRFLRQRTGLNLRQFGDKVGYSDSLISRLEKSERVPNVKWVEETLVPALNIQDPNLTALFIDLANEAHRAAGMPSDGEATLRNAAPYNKFIGRRREMDDLAAALDRHRLVTLCGPGGCGKTRLAIETAQAQRRRKTLEVWFIDLSAIQDPLALPHTVAAGLRTPLSFSDPAGSIARFFGNRSALMVIDNAEHVINASASMIDYLLHACPNLNILVTSREPLRLNGEHVRRLSPLGMPNPAEIDHLALETLRQYDAVELFIDRAGMHGQLDDALDAGAVRLIARVCWRLDGLPLAIELAAACTADMPVKDILLHMDNRFDLLTLGARIAPDRQVSLEQAIDWSHVLLGEDEQRVFRRLAVFAGGWTMPMAMDVCADAICTPKNVMDGVRGLVRKSMVVFGSDEWGAARYSMLESIREYGLRKLQQAGERRSMSSRHAACILKDVERAEIRLFGPEQADVLRALDANLENIRAALTWLMDSGEHVSALQLLGALRRFWQTRGHVGEGRLWLNRALAHKASAPVNIRARAVFTAAVLADYQNDAQASRILNDEAVELAMKSDDPWLAGQILCGLVYRDQTSEANEDWRKRIALAHNIGIQQGNDWLIGDALHKLAAIEVLGNNYRQALDYLRQSERHLKSAGDSIYATVNQVWLGALTLEFGEPKLAQNHFLKALFQMQRTGLELAEHIEISYCLQGLANLAAMEQQHERMARLLGAVEAERERLGGMANHWFPDLDVLSAALRYEQLAGEPVDMKVYRQAWEIGRHSNLPDSVDFALDLPEGIDWLDDEAGK